MRSTSSLALAGPPPFPADGGEMRGGSTKPTVPTHGAVPLFTTTQSPREKQELVRERLDADQRTDDRLVSERADALGNVFNS